MFDLIKLAIIACGCAALYGLATGADLNSLFADLTNQVIPVAQKVLSGLWEFIRNTLSSQ